MGRILEVSKSGLDKVSVSPAHVLSFQLLHEWKNTLCVHSKYKEDLVHIRDMHRLLSYKGSFLIRFDLVYSKDWLSLYLRQHS